MSLIRRQLFTLMLVLMIPLPAFSDVLFLKSGEVVLGALLSASGGNVIIRTLGKERTVEAVGIERTEGNLDVLKNVDLEIFLRDGTVIRGKVIDYDEEIGVFVDISFGNLALPINTIEIIQDPSKVPKKKSDDKTLGFSGLIGLPLSASFGIYGGMSASVDFKLSHLSRLALGADISWNPLSYKPTDEVQYMLFGLNLHALYRFTELGGKIAFFQSFVPYTKLGAGAVVVQLTDNRAAAAVEHQGSLTSLMTTQVGVDWKLTTVFSLRMYLNADVVFQTDGAFVLPGAGLGLFMNF